MGVIIPTKKNREIDKFLTNLSGKDRRKTIGERKCTWCDAKGLIFRDELSIEEYRISGMCQSCQDKTFGKGEEA